MKKSLLKQGCALLIALAANCAYAASGEAADWYFTAENNSWKVDATTQFQATDAEGVYLLKGFNLAGNTAYKITNADWSVSYGWVDGGSVVETGVAYPVEKGASGNGWCGLDAGTYDITFNETASSIEFTLSDTQQEKEEGDIWYLTGTFNGWTLDTQFAASETPGIFVIEKFTLPESATAEGYWDFVITTPAWAVQYICDENLDETDKEYAFVERHDNLAAYSHLPAGEYMATWDKTNHTLKIVKSETTGIEDIAVDESSNAEYYNINGVKVNADNLTSGIYIRKTADKTKKVYIR